MIRSLCRASWITTAPFPRCISRRMLVGVAGTSVNHRVSSADETDERNHNDRALRQIFDSQPAWLEFSRSSTFSKANLRQGLFQNRYLTEPQGFLKFAQDIQHHCQRIVENILNASSLETLQALPRHLDLLSDSLCRVLDASDFVRATHPDARFREAAAEAYAFLWEYMNVLNTTPGLNRQLRNALSSSQVSSLWSEQEMTVAQILLKDFSNSAIDLPRREREKFVNFSNDTKRLGQDFVQNIAASKPYISLDKELLRGLDPTTIGRYPTRRSKVFVATLGDDAYMALGMVHDEDVRRKLYIAGRQAPDSQTATLEALFRTRADIARLSGFESYADMNLADKMAKSPAAVNSFLTALSTDNRPHVRSELMKMSKLKKQRA